MIIFITFLSSFFLLISCSNSFAAKKFAVEFGSNAPLQVLPQKGSSTNGHCVQYDANGNATDSGSACAGAATSPGGGLGSVQYNSPIGSFAGDETKFSFNGTNVGIGTTNAIKKFQVNNSSGARFTIDDNGNVGIGTSTIVGKLNIVEHGDANFAAIKNTFTTNTNTAGILTTGNAGQTGQFINNGTSIAGTLHTGAVEVNSSGVLDVGTIGTSNLTFFTNSLARQIITSGGNVGIGTSLIPTTLTVANADGNNLVDFYDKGDNYHAFKIDGVGTVGIGTPFPDSSQTLDIAGPTTLHGGSFLHKMTGALNTYEIDDQTGNIIVQIAQTSTSMKQNVGIGTFPAGGGGPFVATSKLVVLGGNVGIGSQNAGTILDVQGTSRTTGLQLNLAPLANGNVLVSNSVGVGTWMPPSTIGAGGSTTPGGSSPQIQYNNAGSFGGIAGATNGTNIGIGTVALGHTLNVMGNVGIGTTPYSQYLVEPVTGYSAVIVEGNVGVGTFTPNNAVDVFRVKTESTGANTTLKSYVSIEPTADQDNSLTSIVSHTASQFRVDVPATQTHTIGSTTAADIYATNNGSGQFLSMVGASNWADNKKNASATAGVIGSNNTATTRGTGTIPLLVSTNIDNSVGGTFPSQHGNITEYDGIKIGGMDNTVGVGTITSRNQILMTTMAGTATNDYAIQSLATQPSVFMGNIGIGTITAPAHPLNIVGGVGIGTTNYSQYLVEPLTGTKSLIVEGNVGIGTFTPGAALDVIGTIRTSAFKLTTNPSAGNVLVSGSTGIGTWMAPSTLAGVVASAGGNNRDVQFNSSGSMGGSDNFTWDGTNVGIGTISAVQAFSVVGNVGIGTVKDGDPYLSTNQKTAGSLLVEGNVGVGTWLPNMAFHVEAINNIGIGTYVADTTGTVFSTPMVLHTNLSQIPPSFIVGNFLGEISESLSGSPLVIINGINSTAFTRTTDTGNYNSNSYYTGGSYAASHYGSGTMSKLVGATVFGTRGTGGAAATAGNVTNNWGLSAQLATNVGMGTTTNAYNLVALRPTSVAGAVVTNAAGLFVNNQTSSAGTTTNSYGVYVDTQTDGTNTAWGLYQAGTANRNYLGGNTGIGTLTTQGALTILGNVGIGTIVTDAYLTQAVANRSVVIQGNVGIGTWQANNSLIVGNFNSNAPGGGNVGIGTLAPGVSLDVNGTERFSGSGDSYIAGNLGIGTTIPMGTLAVQGSILQGTAAYTGQAVNTNVVAISGNVGLGTWVPGNALTIIGGNVGISTTGPASVKTGVNGSGSTSCLCKEFASGICVNLGTCT